jgi:peroxiredoxin
VTSADLLEEGPLALTFFRGPWCPYCSLMVEALDQISETVERLGGNCVAVAPLGVAELDAMARERGLGLRLLSDADGAYADVSEVRFEMTPESTALYGRLAARFGQVIPGQDAPGGWVLPVPATYVASRDGVITYRFGDANWARRADPDEIVAAVRRLAQAAVAAG